MKNANLYTIKLDKSDNYSVINQLPNEAGTIIFSEKKKKKKNANSVRGRVFHTRLQNASNELRLQESKERKRKKKHG